ncbi:MAG: hypothetical protein U1E70_07580 [Acetobacteraceae bacterium]
MRALQNLVMQGHGRLMKPITRVLALLPLLVGCSVIASQTAHRAQREFLGMSAEDLQTCIGLPDQHARIDAHTQLLTYNVMAPTSGGISLTVPVVGGITISGGGYCHITVKLQNDAVTEIRYSGEKDEIAAPDAVCAPALRACLRQPEHYAPMNTPFYSPEHIAELEARERQQR